MRNLRNVRFDRWPHQNITATAWDPENDEILCVIGPTADGHIELSRIREGRST